MMVILHRDPSSEELGLYGDPTVFEDPRYRVVFTDPENNYPVLYKGFGECRNGSEIVRNWKLIANGMLLQVECSPFVPWDYMVSKGHDLSDVCPEYAQEARKTVPDLVYSKNLHPIPAFTPPELRDYIRGFTERSIRFLNPGDEMAAFLKHNQQGVVDYLLQKLKDGKLRFYRGRAFNLLENGPIAIEDCTDPQKPQLLFLIYGTRPLIWESTKGPYAYIPWKPCVAEEAYKNPAEATMRIRTQPASARA